MRRDNLSFYENTAVGTVSIVEVPVETGSDVRGFAEAPQYLQDAGIAEMITSIGCDFGDVRRARDGGIEDTAASAASHVEDLARRGDTILALGGDHAAAIGTIAGAARAHASLGVIWIDAHPDVNTPETSLTGNAHGMVAAAVIGRVPQYAGIVTHPVSPKNFLHIGIQDIDTTEIEFLRRESMRTVTMLDIAERGLSRAFMAVDALCRTVDRVWISMDMDAIAEVHAPGVGMPNTSGFSRREILALSQYIGARAKVAGMDIVEVVPHKDIEGKTAGLAVEIAARLLGGEYGQYNREYMARYREGVRYTADHG